MPERDEKKVAQTITEETLERVVEGKPALVSPGEKALRNLMESDRPRGRASNVSPDGEIDGSTRRTELKRHSWAA